jgi:hypothetical protein
MLPRMNYSSFALDPERVLRTMELTNKINGDSSSDSSILFSAQLEWILRKYEATLVYQSKPFIVVLCFGLSLFVIGIITILVDIGMTGTAQKDFKKKNPKEMEIVHHFQLE